MPAKIFNVDVIAKLSFFRNRIKKGAKPSDWVSFLEKIVVFSTSELDDFIVSNKVEEFIESGNSIWVGLVKGSKSAGDGDGEDRVWYHAFPLPQTISAFTKPNSPFRTGILVDGQNFLCGLRSLDFDPNPAKAIDKIASKFDTRWIRFFICRETDIGDSRLITEGEISQIADLPGTEIIYRPYSNGGKSDVDNWLTTELVRSYYAEPGLEGIVVVSGDSDYSSGLDLWTKKSPGGPKRAEVIATRKSVAIEMINSPFIEVTLLEKILVS